MFASLTQDAADDARFSLSLPPSLALQRFYGEEASSDPSDVQVVNIGAGTQQVFLEDLRIRDGHVIGTDPISLTLTWNDPTTGGRHTTTQSWTVAELLHSDTRNVEKALALMAWTDEIRARSGGRACGRAMARWKERAAHLGGDAEIAWMDDLLGSRCDGRVTHTDAPPAMKIKVDSDEAITEVQLRCGDAPQVDTLSAADSVATFDEAPPGTCDVILVGSRAMRAELVVAAHRGPARCTVREGRADCG